jgi:Tol biopolymer transport system component
MTGNRVRASRAWSCLVAAALVATALLAPVDANGASYPGQNGSIAFRRNPGSTLWVANSDGSGERHLGGIQNAAFPSFSPDGKSIAYRAGEGFANGSIAVVGLDGAAPQTIVPQDNAANIIGGPTWSPDGTKLAFSVYNARPEAQVYEIRVVDAATGAAVTTLRSPEVVEAEPGRTLRGDLTSPAWSPTDDQTLAVVHDHAVGFTDIATITLDGTLTDITDEPNGSHEYLDWSPDGTRIAFTQQTEDGSGDSVVKTIGRSGGAPVQVTAEAGRYKDLAYSPDGSKLLLSIGGNFFTIASGASMGTPAILPGAGGDRNEPTWGPGGNAIEISGTITTTDCTDTACAPVPLAGALVRASGPDSAEAVTGPDGTYSIEVGEAGVYTVTPSMPDQPGQGFRPGSRTMYVKADKSGVDFVTCSAGETPEGTERALLADEDLCYSILVEDLNGSGSGGGSLGDFAQIDVPPVNLRFQGAGWNAAGPTIEVFWERKRIKTFPAASKFAGKVVAEYWPDRTSYPAGRAVCGARISGRQGGVTRTVTVLAGAGAVVLFADRDPIFRAGNFICVGEFQSVLKKTPGTVISSDLRGERMIVSRNGRNTPELIPNKSLCVELTKGRGHVVVKRVDGRLDVSGRKPGDC